MKEKINQNQKEGGIKEIILDEPLSKIAFGIMEEWLIQGNEITKFDQYILDIEKLYQDLRDSDPKSYNEHIANDLKSLVAEVALQLVDRISSDVLAGSKTHVSRIKMYQSLLQRLTDTVNGALRLMYKTKDFERVLVPDLYLYLNVPKDGESA